MKKIKKLIIRSLFQDKPWYQSEKKSPISSVLAISGNIIQYFPKFIKYPLLKVIDNIGLFIIRIMRLLPISTQPYYVIQETGLSKEQKIKILYQGNLPSIIFFIKKIFAENSERIITPLSTSPKNKKESDDLKDNFDLCILEKDFFFKPSANSML